LLLLGSALAGVTIGTITNAVAKMASVKSRIANLFMRASSASQGCKVLSLNVFVS
jgi:hypothetical protein